MKLLTWIRGNWDAFRPGERRWLERYWPGCEPSGADTASVPPPDAEAIRLAVRGALVDAPAYDFNE